MIAQHCRLGSTTNIPTVLCPMPQALAVGLNTWQESGGQTGNTDLQSKLQRERGPCETKGLLTLDAWSRPDEPPRTQETKLGIKSDPPDGSLTPAQPTDHAVCKNNHQRATQGQQAASGSWLPSNSEALGPVSTLPKASQVISGRKKKTDCCTRSGSGILEPLHS